MKIRAIAAPLAALALGIVLGLALLEGGVRLLGRRHGFVSTKVEADYRAPWSRPDFRPVPEPGNGPPFRIVVVGDSFTWGDGVLAGDAYPRRLERLLWAADLPVRVEVHIISRPGWGSADEEAALRSRWHWLEPDLLVVGYVLNDPLPAPGVENERLREPTKRRQPGPGLPSWLYRHSSLFDLVWDRLENTRQRRAFRDHYQQLHSPDQPSWKRARVALKRMADRAAADDIPAVLVIWPVFDFERWEDYAYADIHRTVRRVARRDGYRVLDLLPVYRGVEGSRLPVTPFTDAHPDELAHRLAAQEIARYLLAKGLVPTRTQEGRAETPAPVSP